MLNARPQPETAPDARAVATIARLLSERTGQELGASRAWRVNSVVQPILRQCGVADLPSLASQLEAHPGAPLADMVVDSLLNQETSFFRDPGVIDMAADVLAEQRKADPARRLRLWSAGCSVGQEPYSLAMLLAERAEGSEDRVDIVATDVSWPALTRARAGRYSQFEIQRGLPVRRMLNWFEQDGDEWVVQPELSRMIVFRHNNLAADPAPCGRFDVILCRNVLLYFPLALRRQVFERLADALRPDGVLVLGAGETTIGQTDRFAPSNRFRGAYQLSEAVI